MDFSHTSIDGDFRGGDGPGLPSSDFDAQSALAFGTCSSLTIGAVYSF